MTAQRQRTAKGSKPVSTAGRRSASAPGKTPHDRSADAVRVLPQGSLWCRRADAVGARIAISALHAGALAEIRRAVAAGETVALACSGGADSVALVLSLWAHVPEARGRWLILHFDHALRGKASTADARFVRILARGLGETCMVERWDRSDPPCRAGALRHAAGTIDDRMSDGFRGVAQSASPTREGSQISEAGARDARFSFFARAMREAGARVLALGHQADDVVETMLMRLARGSATAGLAAPRPVHRRADGTVRVRPLLEVEASVVRAALRSAKVPWREDATNAGHAFARNRVRHAVMPALRAAVGRDLERGFLEARRALEEDDEALGAWVHELLATSGFAVLRGRPRALARRAVQAWLQVNGVGGSLSRSAAHGLVDAVVAGNPTHQSAGVGRFVVFNGHQLAITTDLDRAGEIGWGEGVWLEVGAEVANACGDVVSARLVRLTARLRAQILGGRMPPTTAVWLATDDRRFFVRKRKPGDRYRPLGAPGRIRLQDAFVNRKIPRELRDRLPVVAGARGEAVWVPGLPPAQELFVQQGTKLVVQLTYHRAGAIVPASPVLPTLSQDHVRA